MKKPYFGNWTKFDLCLARFMNWTANGVIRTLMNPSAIVKEQYTATLPVPKCSGVLQLYFGDPSCSGKTQASGCGFHPMLAS